MGFLKKLKEKILEKRKTSKIEKENFFSKETKKVTKEKKFKKKVKDPKSIDVEKSTSKSKDNDEILDALKSKRNEEILKYERALSKTNVKFTKKIIEIVSRKKNVSDELYDELEEFFISSDMGYSYTLKIISKLKERLSKLSNKNPEELVDSIFEVIFSDFLNNNSDKNVLSYKEGVLNVYFVIGVNGSGKTTSIAKISKFLLDRGKKVHLSASDTFRSGAVEQLNFWSEKLDLTITNPIKQFEDPSAVIYRSLKEAKENGSNVLIIDTSGRLQNKENLMNQLSKMNKVIKNEINRDIDEALLVFDSTMGQNGILQVEEFSKICNLTGLIVTKMDASSKGGIILPILEKFNIPIKFIGLGEKIDDFRAFDLEKYVYGLLSNFEINQKNSIK